MFTIGSVDHVGLRVTDIARAQAFYERLGFRVDPDEESPEAKARGLVNARGVRIHLIYNGEAAPGGNVLMDIRQKWPGYTHAAFVVDNLDDLIVWLGKSGVPITEGPVTWGEGRRRALFVRDPDLNVIEFNQIIS